MRRRTGGRGDDEEADRGEREMMRRRTGRRGDNEDADGADLPVPLEALGYRRLKLWAAAA